MMTISLHRRVTTGNKISLRTNDVAVSRCEGDFAAFKQLSPWIKDSAEKAASNRFFLPLPQTALYLWFDTHSQVERRDHFYHIQLASLYLPCIQSKQFTQLINSSTLRSPGERLPDHDHSLRVTKEVEFNQRTHNVHAAALSVNTLTTMNANLRKGGNCITCSHNTYSGWQ